MDSMLSRAERVTLEQLGCPPLLTVLTQSTYLSPDSLTYCRVLHTDPDCSRQAIPREDDHEGNLKATWRACGGCYAHDPDWSDLTEACTDLANAHYGLELARAGLRYRPGTSAAQVRTAEQLSDVMLSAGYVPDVRNHRRKPVRSAATAAWLADQWLAVHRDVDALRSVMRERWYEELKHGVTDERWLLVLDAARELKSDASYTGLRELLVRSTWVAGGGDHRWAVLRVPAVDGHMHFRPRLRDLGSADLGPVNETCSDELWSTFAAVHDNADAYADGTLDAARAVLLSPALT